MKFSLGDRVLLKRTGEEGTIIAFLSKQMIEVEVGDIRFPVYADEIDHPYLKWFTDPKKPKTVKSVREIPVEKEAAKPPRLSRGIYLSFLPQFAATAGDDIIESFRIHLLNETADHLAFSYYARSSSGTTFLQLAGSLHPFANIFLHTISLEDLNAQPRFNWSVVPKDKQDSGINNVLRIRPAQLVRHIAALLHEGQPSFNILLSQDAEAIPSLASSAILLPSIKPPAASESKIELHTEAVRVLDLHLSPEELYPDRESPALLLDSQLRLLEQKLNAAFIAGQDTMVVIHGIGAGTLREAVHDLLRRTPYVAHFSNHWMAAYGWGATEIRFGRKA